SVYTDSEPGEYFGEPTRSYQMEVLRYVAESDPEEDPEEYEDDETEDGPVDYPINGGDDGDDDDGDSFGDDANDEDEDEEEEEEEEEHLALADSVVVKPTDDLASISFPPKAEVERLLAMPTPSPSPLTSLSPSSAGERLVRCTTSAALPSPPLPPPLHMPPPIDHRDDIPETKMPPRKRLCLSTLGSRYEVEESSTARLTGGQGIDYGFVSTLDAEARRRGIKEVRYGIRDTWIDPAETIYEIAPMTVEVVITTVTELAELHEHDTQDLYALDSPVMGDMRREMGDMQAELLALREQPRRAGQFVADETEKIDKYVNGLLDNIYESVKASKPKTLDETIELANDLMDLKLRTYAKRQSNNKRKADESFRNNHGHQQQTPKRQNVTRVYAVGNAEKRGNVSRDPDSNVIMSTFLFNNRYASILFDTGADRSFISTAFSSLIDIVPTPLGNSYDVRARITVRLQAAISFPPEAEVKRLLAMLTPSPSPLASLSSPSVGERLARCTAPAALPSPPLPLPPYMPPPVDRRDDIPETEMPPRK
nr:reverse transcriptase domain-containing protein [Tanacetum cinerariifolium]